MSDLHTALEAAITARLEVARAATPGPWTAHQSSSAGYDDKRDWFIAELARFRGHLLNHVYFDDDEQTARHIAANDPAQIIRDCDYHLKVLERHAPDPDTGRCFACMEWCECPDDRLVRDCPCRGNQPHPCAEIRDMHAVYPEVTR